MDEIKSKETKKPRNRSKAICRKTGDHVHYPPTRRTKPTRPTHAPLPNLKSSFRFPDKEPPRYGKCRKNQAAGIGTTAYDGCGEFVSAIPGEEDSLNCAACGCHRSFHREEEEEEVKEEEEESVLERCIKSNTIDDSVLEMLKISSCQFRQIFCSPYGDRRKRKSNGEEELVKEEEEEEKERVVKRLKTKFTEEQTEKMRSYAEKLRWKMSSENGNEVDEFCVEIGVHRKNFRIWMNNHKDKN